MYMYIYVKGVNLDTKTTYRNFERKTIYPSNSSHALQSRNERSENPKVSGASIVMLSWKATIGRLNMARVSLPSL